MITSMTGFGKAKNTFGGGEITVEVKTFNHKYYEASVKLPEQIQPFEEQVKKILRKSVRRGKLYLWVNYDPAAVHADDIVIDEKRLQRYYHLLHSIKKKFRLPDEVTLSQMLVLPGVIASKPKKENKRQLLQALETALEKAMSSLTAMRRKEGSALFRDLTTRVKNICTALAKIQALVPREIERYRQKLEIKVAENCGKNGGRQDRLEEEVALFAKNCDISEELTRLQSHVEHFQHVLDENTEAGKVLDFIAQEMQREINTVGAKSVDFSIAKEVIFIKSEIEKIREQVQNIE
ncbi:MAG: YicC family protein [Candidatus Omnitrophica bacterium]|nr:YicC family protein [Candidatus Omnitrophota bacterium]